MTAFHLVGKHCQVTNKAHPDYDNFNVFSDWLFGVCKDNNIDPQIETARDRFGFTGLHYAACQGNAFVIKHIHQKNKLYSILDEIDMQKNTALLIAIQKGHIEVVRVLLQFGAKRNIDNSKGRDCIHLAAFHGHLQLLKELIDDLGSEAPNENDSKKRLSKKLALDLKILKKDDQNNNILHLAVNSKSLATVNYIIREMKLGKQLNKPNKWGEFPIHRAAKANLISIVDALIRDQPDIIDATNKQKKTALHLASENGFDNLVELLLRHGADTTIEDHNQGTAVVSAAGLGNDTTLSLLLKSQIKEKIDAITQDDRKLLTKRTILFRNIGASDLPQPVHPPAENESLKMFKPNDHNRLMKIAIENNNPEQLKEILFFMDSGDLFDVKNFSNELPIHTAAHKGNIACLQILLDSNLVDETVVLAKTLNGRTACHLAAEKGFDGIIKMIIERYPEAVYEVDDTNNTPLHIAALHKHHKCLKILLKEGTQLEHENYHRCNVFDCVVISGSVESLDLLIRHGSLDLAYYREKISYQKNNPLHLAAKWGKKDILIKLLHYGLDISIVDKEGLTVLQEAIKYKKGQVIESIIDCKYWKESFGNNSKTKTKVMKDLIEHYPNIAEKVMDKCVKEVKHRYDNLGDEYKELHFNVQFLEDVNSKSKSTSDHPLCTIVKKRQANLLKHPLCLAWVKDQWNSQARYVFFIETITYFLYLVSLTYYCSVSLDRESLSIATNSSFKKFNATEIEDKLDQRNTRPEVQQALAFVIVTTCINMFYEVMQVNSIGISYFKRVTNIIDLFLYFGTIILLWSPSIEMSLAHCYSRLCWRWPFSAVLQVTGWLNFLRYLTYFSFFGIFLSMFSNILLTVSKLSFILAIFILAFSFGFHATLMNQDGFSVYGWAYLKTLIMSTGEFEYESIFHDSDSVVPFPFITITLFIGLIVVMTFVLLNMLIGIAVDNISKIQEDAEIEKVSSMIDLVFEMRKPWFRSMGKIGKKLANTLFPNYFATEVKHYDGIISIVCHEKSPLGDLLTMKHFLSCQNIWDLYKERKFNKHNQSELKTLLNKVDELNVKAEKIGSKVEMLSDELQKIENLGKLTN